VNSMTIKDLSALIKTQRLEMRRLDATAENARLVFDALKNESPDDYIFNPIAWEFHKMLPDTVDEMHAQMKKEDESYNTYHGFCYGIFLDNELIGCRSFYLFKDTKTLKTAHAWFLKRFRNMGFGQETMAVFEKIGFEQLGANRVFRRCSADNVASAEHIKRAGYHLDGINRQGNVDAAGRIYDEMLWSKLRSEYKG